MSYLSPFQLLDLQLGPEGLSSKDLKRAKKRLLAELELSPGQQLQLAGKRLSKNDLLELFEQLEDPAERDLHQRIYRHKSLLQFLEYGQLSYLKSGDKLLKQSGQSDLAQFVAPHFAKQYSEALVDALKAKDLEQIEAIPPAEELLPEQYVAACYQDSYYLIRDHQKRVEELPDKERAPFMTERELLFELEKDSILCYNALPDYFQVTRDAFAETIAEAALDFIRRCNRLDAAKALLGRGKLLQLTEEGERALKEAKQRIPSSFISFNGGIPLWLIIGVGVVALLFLIKFLEDNVF